MYIQILGLAAASAVSTAGGLGLDQGGPSRLDIGLPALVDARDDLTQSAIDPDATGLDMLIVTEHLTTSTPMVWSAKSETAMSDLEQNLLGSGVAIPGLSNRLTAASGTGTRSSFGGGLGGGQGDRRSYDEQFTKSTVIPLPSAGLLAAVGLSAIGIGRHPRRR